MHNSHQASDPTLAKLLEADSNLAAQAATLSFQLTTIQEKRRSLQAVIDMFSATHPATPVVEKQQTNGAEPTVAAPTSPQSLDAAPIIEPAIEKVEAVSTNGSTSQSTKPTGRRRSSTRAAKPSKSIAKDSGWRRYVRKEFAKTSLPEAVSIVLQEQPDEVFDVPEIVSVLFVDATPKDARSEARNRVSNVLSVGLKDNKWYRGKKGQYSLSQEAAKASMTS